MAELTYIYTMDTASSMRKFFQGMAITAILSAARTDLSNLQLIDIVKNISMTFAFNFIVGIPGGLSWMLGTDLYVYIKKLTINK